MLLCLFSFAAAQELATVPEEFRGVYSVIARWHGDPEEVEDVSKLDFLPAKGTIEFRVDAGRMLTNDTVAVFSSIQLHEGNTVIMFSGSEVLLLGSWKQDPNFAFLASLNTTTKKAHVFVCRIMQ